MFELQTIYKLGGPYLKKWRIFGYLSKSNSKGNGEFGKEIKSKLPLALRIHRFFQIDKDKCPHNHPWKWAVSFIFWGGYTEWVFDVKTGLGQYKTHMAPAINIIRHKDYHMVTDLFGTPMTLFFVGPRTSSWGFWDGFRHIDWKEFLGVKEDK